MRQAQVFKLLQAQDTACRGSRHIRFMGHLVCCRGFMKLLGVGKHRFATLHSAAQRGDEFCPYDGRYVIKEKRPPSDAWMKVHGYLTQLYSEAGEAIPDGWNSNKRPRSGLKKQDSANLDRTQMRHLPHASISDYWRQCVDAHPGVTISRKLFCADSTPEFSHHFHITFFFW